ncbi:MAG: hypothetical protein QHC40_02450 [Sphingobium sp.]|nr:hypothetical protein [Sphingobium sp.]
MRGAHLPSIWAAIALAVILLIAILLGSGEPFPAGIGGKRSVRDVALALWTFLVPAWFMIEELWFSPPKSDPAAIERFLVAQHKARVTWTVIGGAVAIMIGVTAPDLLD